MNIPLIIVVLTALAAIVTILGISGKDLYFFIKTKLQPYPFPVRGEILRCYKVMKKHKGRLGKPISPEQPAAHSKRWTTGRVQRFEGNADGARVWHQPRKGYIMAVSIYSSKQGTYPVWGSIGQCFEKHKGTAGSLGFPTSGEEEISNSPKTVRQRFEGGSITCEHGQDPIIQNK